MPGCAASPRPAPPSVSAPASDPEALAAATEAVAAALNDAGRASVLPGLLLRRLGALDDALTTAEQAGGAAYIEVITDAYEAPPMYKKLHEHVESFYNLR
jgi:hypothetical protein